MPNKNRLKPSSLHPLSPEEALGGAMEIEPPEDWEDGDPDSPEDDPKEPNRKSRNED